MELDAVDEWPRLAAEVAAEHCREGDQQLKMGWWEDGKQVRCG